MMLRLRGTLLAPLLMIGGCAAPSSSPMTAAHASAIVDSVRATLAAFADRLNAADRDSLLKFYRDDPRFVWAADGRVATHSVAEIGAQLKALSGFPHWHIEYVKPMIVPLAPGVAEVATEYTMTLADSAGKAISFVGANTMVWVASPGGWKILGGHSSSPGAPAR